MNENTLTEKGFVFLDEQNKPFHIRLWGGAPWLFYWHPDKRWVSLREVNQMEIWNALHGKVTTEEAEKYHQLSEREH